MITKKEKQEAYGELISTPSLTMTILAVLTVSATVSIASTLMMVDKFNIPTKYMFYFVIGGILLLVLLDYVKRLFYSLFINSEIKAPVLNKSKSILSLIMTLATIIAILMIDLLGSYSTAIMVETTMQKDNITNSLDFEILEKNKLAESITHSSTAYQEALYSYNLRKSDHITACNNSWRVPRYRTKNGQCLDKFKEEQPKKNDFVVSATINKKDIEKIREENDNFFVSYIFYIVFAIIGIILGVLNYLTLSEMVEKREDFLTLLTDTRVSIIQGFLSKIQIERDETTRKLLEKIQDHTKEVSKQKIEAKELALALSRNEEESLLNQLKTNVKDSNVTAQNYTIKKRNSKGTITKDKEEKTIINDEFKKDDIIFKLFLNGTAKIDDKLTPKGELINIKDRQQNQKMVNLYKELEKEGLVKETRGQGYFSLINYKEAS